MRLLLVFVDGVGLGKTAPDNPFVFHDTPFISRLLGNCPLTVEKAGYKGLEATLIGLDASLGIPGLPQSATGQAAIFTGVNAAAYLGAHLNGFPNQKLRRLLAAEGIFRKLGRSGFNSSFVNAYRPPFFNLLRRGLPGNRYSCSTLITYYGGLPFNTLEDVRRGKALYMDITNGLLKNAGYDLPLIEPEEGAGRLLRISRDYNFSLFEFFLTDLAGHFGDSKEAGRVIGILDRFIGALSAGLNPAETLLVLTSDHGNLEVLSNGDHTHNPVPALLIGEAQARKYFARNLNSIVDLAPAIISFLAKH